MSNKVIVTYRNFHDIDREEIFPEVFRIPDDQDPTDALREIWEDQYNGLLAEQLLAMRLRDETDSLDEDGCWYEEDRAMIAWADGDTKEFYVVDVEEYKV